MSSEGTSAAAKKEQQSTSGPAKKKQQSTPSPAEKQPSLSDDDNVEHGRAPADDHEPQRTSDGDDGGHQSTAKEGDGWQQLTSSATSADGQQQVTPAERYKRLGLGRGVDITKRKPWTEKSAFQMRAVHSQDLIETDEGGLLMEYSELVDSNTSVRSKVQTGVVVPNVPVSIGVGSEYSRKECSSRQLVGLKVKNRTISFRLNFHDFPRLPVTNLEGAREQLRAIKRRKFSQIDKSQSVGKGAKKSQPVGKDAKKSQSVGKDATDGGASAAESVPRTHEDLPFEVHLCKWLSECVENRAIPVEKNAFLVDLLYMRIGDKPDDKSERDRLIDDDEQTRLLVEDISRFVEHLGITHYISAIELGGLHFSILTEKEYEKKISVDGSVSVNSKIYGGLEASAKHSRSKKFKSSLMERKMIGRITEKGDRQVVMPEDEAVIGYELRPISSLVHNLYLQLAVNKAVHKYIQTETKCQGSYLILCGDDQPLYLAVDERKKIIVTHKKAQAEPFVARVVNEAVRHHELEFSLTSTLSKHKGQAARGENEQSDMEPLEYTLEVAPLIGHGSNTPRMKLSTDYRRTRLLLKKRSDHRISCDPKDWIEKGEACLIQCVHPVANRYLCVKERKSYRRMQSQRPQIGRNQEQEASNRFKMCVRRSALAKGDESCYCTLFRLQPECSSTDAANREQGQREGQPEQRRKGDEGEGRPGEEEQREGRREHEGEGDEGEGEGRLGEEEQHEGRREHEGDEGEGRPGEEDSSKEESQHKGNEEEGNTCV